MKYWLVGAVIFALAACGGTIPATRPMTAPFRAKPAIVQTGPGVQHWGVWKDALIAGQMTADHSGDVWYITGTGVAKMNYSASVTHYPIPWPTPPSYDQASPGIALGNDGNIWLASIGAIFRVTPAGVVTRYATSTTSYGGITSGTSSDLWFVSQRLYHYNYSTRVLQSFPIPSGETGSGITRGPDGNIWFITPNTVDRATQSGAITSFSKPQIGSLGINYAGASIIAGPDGDLWTSNEGCQAQRISTNGATVSSFTWGPYGPQNEFCAEQIVSTLGGVWNLVAAWDNSCDFYPTDLVEALPNGSQVTSQPPNYMFGGCLGGGGYAGEALGSDGDLYFALPQSVGVRMLDAIVVKPYSVAFSGTRQFADLSVSEENYTGIWTAGSTQPTIVKVVSWLTKSKLRIESIGVGSGRIIIRDNRNNYYNVNITVK